MKNRLEHINHSLIINVHTGWVSSRPLISSRVRKHFRTSQYLLNAIQKPWENLIERLIFAIVFSQPFPSWIFIKLYSAAFNLSSTLEYMLVHFDHLISERESPNFQLWISLYQFFIIIFSRSIACSSLSFMEAKFYGLIKTQKILFWMIFPIHNRRIQTKEIDEHLELRCRAIHGYHNNFMIFKNQANRLYHRYLFLSKFSPSTKWTFPGKWFSYISLTSA